MKKAASVHPSRQRGAALLEALISVLIFSMGILALVGLQAAMTKNATDAHLRAQASYLANQLIGRMWVDQPNLASYDTDAAAYGNRTAWVSQVANSLPSGSATVDVSGTTVTITIGWRQAGRDAASSYNITAAITN